MKLPVLGPVSGLIVALLLASACAAGGASVKRTLDASNGVSFQRILVIAVAAGYEGRAMFERDVTSRIRAAGGEAEAYYRLVGNNPPIDRERVVAEVEKGGFDAVLFTRVKDQEMSAAKKQGTVDAMATTRGGSLFNFFRYDYEEFDEPSSIDFTRSVVLATELYSTASREKVWAIETTSKGKTNVGELVDSVVDAVVKRLERDGLIGAR